MKQNAKKKKKKTEKKERNESETGVNKAVEPDRE